MRKYPKINSIFKREPEKPRRLINGDYATKEIADLANVPWDFTEKCDGMNIRVGWDGDRTVEFGGRTDRALLPAPLLTLLYATFTPGAFREAFGDESGPVLLFGEGYGKGIQKGGSYRKDQGFILFDVVVGDKWWLQRKDVDAIAAQFGVPSVPALFTSSLEAGIEYVKSYPQSHIGECVMEGLVGRPRCGLKDRRGEPIMVKIKVVDFTREQEVAREGH